MVVCLCAYRVHWSCWTHLQACGVSGNQQMGKRATGGHRLIHLLLLSLPRVADVCWGWFPRMVSPGVNAAGMHCCPILGREVVGRRGQYLQSLSQESSLCRLILSLRPSAMLSWWLLLGMVGAGVVVDEPWWCCSAFSMIQIFGLIHRYLINFLCQGVSPFSTTEYCTYDFSQSCLSISDINPLLVSHVGSLFYYSY